MKILFFRSSFLLILFSVVIPISSGTLSAQKPTIASFIPTSGPIGSTVSINGTNFSTTPADNIVWFGAVKATVNTAMTTQLTVTVPPSATYKPISVTIAGNTAYSSKPFNITFPSTHIIDAQAFASSFFFGTSPSPWDLAEGDMDGDDKPDVILIKSLNNILTVYRNTSISGYITASSLAASFDIPTGSNPICADIGDLDGDGKLDLVVTNNLDGTISIFRNTSTSGSITFDTRVDFIVGSNPYDVAIGDIDGDGKPDLAVTNNGSNIVSVLRNTSTPGSITSGSFAAKIDFTTGTNPSCVAIGDIDGDGKPDLIVNNLDDNTVSIFRNTSTPGSITSGSFASSIDFVTGSRPYAVAVSDLDGDGKQDLVVTNNSSNTVSVFRNTSTSGSITSGSLASKVDFTTGADPYGLSIGEIDGDGRPDLAVACYNGGISVFRNTSISGSITNNSFAAKVDFGATPGPANVIIGDFEGDGKPDLFIATNVWAYLDVYLNTLSKPVPPVITSFTPTSGPVGTEVTISGENFYPTPSENIVWFGAVQATVTAATATQLTVTVPTGATYQPISVTTTLNGLTGYSNAPFTVTFPSSQVIDVTAFDTNVDFITGATPSFVAISDIDGDGKPDLVVTNQSDNTISVYRNISASGSISAGSFASKVDLITGSSPIDVAIGDIDGDGKPDLVVTNGNSNTISVYRNTCSSGSISTGSFAPKVDLVTGLVPCFAAIRDIDGDGKPDLVVANYGSYSFSLYRNISTSGVITSSSFDPRVDMITGSRPYRFSIGDIDGDSKPDLVVTNRDNNSISVFRNTSISGSITASSFSAGVDFTTGVSPYNVAIGDIDGDGKPDLAVTNWNNNTVSLFRNTSTSGSITSGSFATKIDFFNGIGPYCVAIGDIDGDGKSDLVVTNSGSNTVSVFRNTAMPGSITSGSLALKVDFITGLYPSCVAIGDIDGDGKPDLVTANINSNTISVLRNTISAPLPPTISSFAPTSGPIGTEVTITGTNFDTTPANNIIWFGAVRATVTAATETVLTVTVPAGATYQPITVTANGYTAYSAIPFTVTFTGAWFIDATAFAPKVDFIAGSESQGVALGDIDGDGKPDLVIANSNSNTISVYRNTSTSGTITEGSFASGVGFNTGSYPRGVIIGDIDGDGKQDVVVLNYNGNSISVYRNTSSPGSITSGSLADKVDFTTGNGPLGAAIVDIDGDGKPDLVITNYNSNTVSVFRNTSTKGSITAGSFAPKLDLITGLQPAFAALGDIDGDSKPDIVVSNFNSHSISVYRNISTSGSISTGSFDPRVDFVTGSRPYGVAIGDLDGDSKSDISVVSTDNSVVSVFRNISTSGSISSGSLAPKVDFATGTAPYSIVLNDINGDGKPDLVVENYISNTVSVLKNSCISGSIMAGSFAAKVDFTGGGSFDMAVGDIDGDGKPDLVVTKITNNTVSVLHNEISERVPPVITSFTPAFGLTGTTVTISGTNFSTTAADNIVWFGAVKGMVAAATSTSLDVTVPTGATYQPITVTVNGLTAYSSAPFIVTIPGTNNLAATSFAPKIDFTPGSASFGVAIGDLDMDGKPDMAVANWGANTVSIFRNISSSGSITEGSFAPKIDFPTGSNPHDIAIGDIDGDGKPDLVVSNMWSYTVSVFRNTSTPGSITTGSFAPGVDFPAGGARGIAIGDIDGDGKSDLAVTSYTNIVSVFRNTSVAGTIDASSFCSKVDFTTGLYPERVDICDIDGDGKPDMAVVGSNNTVSVFRNTSTIGYITASSFAERVDLATANSYGVDIGDIDGDGKADLVVSNNGGGFVSVFRNTSTAGSIAASSFDTRVDFSTGSALYFVTIGDIDGDGKPDIAAANVGNNTISVFRNTSTSGSITSGSFAAKIDFATGTQPFDVALGDIDGDGKSDLVVTNFVSGTVSVLRNKISEPLPPVITSFAPTSGPIGTTVTVTGTNFSTTPANNIVWFGAVQATVTASTATQLIVTVPTGASYQPISVTDITTGLTAYSNSPFTITFPSTRIIDATAFSTNVNFTTGSQPYGVAIGDIDCDGKPDLAVGNNSSNTVSVFRNTSTSGSITAGSFTARVDFTSGVAPASVAIGDIDGDGKPDLAVTNWGTNTVSVFRNTSTSGSITSGSFAAGVDFPVGANPESAAIGDIDGDGKPDLVVSNFGNSVSVLRNTSTSGSITTSSFTAKVDFTAGTNPWGVTIGDIDGDGKPDLAVTNFNSNTVSVFRNTSSSGSITTGSFATRVDFTVGANPEGVAIGDIDGDGKPDLAIANTGSNTVSVFRNMSSSGSITAGTFATKVDFNTGLYPAGIAIGDIDGNGKLDLAVTNFISNTVSVFRNTSTSGFITAGSFAAKVDFATGTNPYSATLGDIDGDGKPDLAIININSNTVSVLRNTMSAPMPPVITSFTPTSGPVGTPVTITGSNFSTTTANNIVWFGAVQATVTTATSTSLSVIVPTGVTYQPFTVTVNGLTAYSNAPFTVTNSNTGPITPYTFSTKIDFTTGTHPWYTAIGDLDGDGKPDLVVANLDDNNISIYRNISATGTISVGSFAAKVDLATGTNPQSIKIGDIDGDGKPDIVVANFNSSTVSVFRNNCVSGSILSNSFDPRVDFATGTSPYFVNIADIDGDGKSDLFVTNYTSSTFSILRNSSFPGSISVSSFEAKVDFTCGSNPFFAALGDIDGDSKPDLIIPNWYSNTVSIYRNNSTPGSITISSLEGKVDFATGNNPQFPIIADIDGDGKNDLALTNWGSNNVSFFRNTSTSGSITETSLSNKVDITTKSASRGIAMGDIDGDGKPDLAVANYLSKSVSIFRNVSTSGSITESSFATSVEFNTGSEPYIVAIGDIEGDGYPDMVVANFASNSISVFRNKISEPLPPVITTFAPTSGPVGTTVTINGSHFNPTPVNNIVWFGAVKATVTAATSTSLSVLVPTGATYQPITATVGGLTAYSNTPFVVTFPDSRIIDAATLATKVDFTTGTNPANIAIADIDGDGKPDLAVANHGSNTISVFRNTSSSGSIEAGSFSPKVDFDNGTNPGNIAFGDIDGDGKPDLIVTNGSSNTVSVFRNTSVTGSIESGSFASKVYFTTGMYPQSVAIGDIDGDGKPDLAVTNSGSVKISVLMNTCTIGDITSGSFAAKVDFTSGTDPRDITIGDIDGDGKPDLAVTNYAGNTVSVFRNTSMPGVITTGSFAEKVDFITGTNTWSIAVGDIDSDGKSDIVVTYLNATPISVFRNTSISGSISFAAKVDFPAGTNPYCIAINDIDGDCKLDLIVTNSLSNTVSILRNTGITGSITDGSFAPKIDFPTGNYPEGVVIGDIDGDGKPDVAITNYYDNTISILKNTLSAPTPPVINSIAPTSGPVGTVVTISGSNFSTIAANNIVWFGAVKATVTSATSTSLSAVVPKGATYQPITVTVDRLTAWSGTPFIVTFPNTQIFDAKAFEFKVDITSGTAPVSSAIADIDGDGKADILIANANSNSVSIYRNISTSGSIKGASFAPRVDFITGISPERIAIGDIDGDGKPDLVVLNHNSNSLSVFWNTSTPGSITTGSFAPKVDFATGENPYFIAIGDINGDGKPDLAVTNWASNTVSVFRNTSISGPITSASFDAKVDFVIGDYPTGVIIGDIDGDGKPDLAVNSVSNKTVSILRNTSTFGSFTSDSFASKVDFGIGTGPLGLALGDIDGDGKPDIVLNNSTSNTVSIFRNICTSGSISGDSFENRVDFITDSNPYGVTLTDIDGDGKLDIAVANSGSNNVSVFRNTSTIGFIGTGSLAPMVDLNAGSNPQCISIGDIDGDGKPDLVVPNSYDNTVSVLRNRLSEPKPPTISSFTPTSGQVGTTVTITGTNFSSTPENDIVWFGAVKATVTSATSTSLSVVVPAGATYQPITVTANGYTAYSSMPFIVTFPGVSFIDATAFATKVDFITGTEPQGVAIGDIDGDGKPDIAVTNWGANTVSIYRNISTSGSVAEGSFDTKVDLATGTGPYGVVLTDIDCDGKPDLLVACRTGNVISVFRNASIPGSFTIGTFSPKVDLTTGTDPQGIAIRDIDGDGKPDLIVPNYTSNTVSVFRNTSSSGSITEDSFAPKIDLLTGLQPCMAAIGDIDGDGKPDLVVTNQNSHSISVYRNNSTSGIITSSSFHSRVDFVTGTRPYGVAIGDLDGDSKPDISVVSTDNAVVSVFRNNGNSGFISPGSVAPKVDFATGPVPYSIVLSDINGDGKPDLVVGNYGNNTVSVLVNSTISGTIWAGSFAAKVDFAGGCSFDMAVGDMDGDGKPDLVAANISNQTVSVLHNKIFERVPPVIASFTPTSGAVSTAVTIAGTNFSPIAENNIVWFGAVKATVTSATSTSLSVTVPTGASYQPINVTVNGLTAYSGSPFTVTFPSAGIFNTSCFATKVDFTTGSNPNYSAISDIDGDGKPDLVVSNAYNNSISVYRNTSMSGSVSSGTFRARVDFSTGTNPNGIAIGDIDGDGKPDIIVTNGTANNISVFRNTSTPDSIGPNSFAAKIDIAAAGFPQTVSLADIDGDGKTDIVVTNNEGLGVSIYRNMSTPGYISASSFAPKVDFTTGTGPWHTSFAIGDIDGDGKPDLAVTNSYSGTVSIFRNTSTPGSIAPGSFADKVDIATGANPWSVAIGDIDGDGKTDLTVTYLNNNKVSVFRNTNPSGSITLGSFAPMVDFTTGSQPYYTTIGDITGDGKPDLAVIYQNGNTISIFRNTSTSGSINSGSFDTRIDFYAGGNSTCVALGDIDGDGKPDLVVTNGIPNTVSVLRNTIPETLPPSPPVINSFTPASGPIGTSVTINGANFSTTATNNIVWFGAVKAEVTAATSTSLNVTVPTGATYQPITVTVNGLTAWSSTPFNVTFPSSRIIDATAFAEKVDFISGTDPKEIVVGDIDGDGKPDLIVTNINGNNISVYRNTSVSGSLSAGSFASKVDFPTAMTPSGITIGDIDGDGKIDLIVANNNSVGSVSVFRNTSTTGSITSGSFATRVDLPTGNSSNNVAIVDIDGDGKPDLAITNFNSNTISIYKNNSLRGSITESSFSPRVDFPAGDNLQKIAFGDIDGDGKPDMVVPNFYINTVSVYRNTSSPGSITLSSFAAKVDYTTGTHPSGVAIADIDKDGKPDIAISNLNSYTVSIFRNTSTSGAITTSSLATREDFPIGTTPYDVAFADIDGDGKPDLAVENTSNSVSVFRNSSSSGSIGIGSFAAKVDFTAGGGFGDIAISDIDGDGKPDLVVTNNSGNTVSVLRNTISADAPVPPTITSFAPASGSVGTTVTIQGSNFSTTPADNTVLFGTVQASVSSAASTQLTVIVPAGATTQLIYVTVNGLTANSGTSFTVTASASDPPVISSFNPASGLIGSTVTINGSNFSANISNNIVKFGTVQAAVISATATQLSVIVPAGTTNQPIYVTVNGLTAYTSTSFMVIATPVIASFNPSSGPAGTTVTIQGTNFSTTPADNTVLFGTVQASVSSATSTQLTVIVPAGATNQLIYVTVNGLTANSGTSFTVTASASDQPVISSFNPASGLIGSTVTITGLFFSAMATDNIVRFGTVPAAVISATTTQLSVLVPAGATNQPIYITVNNLTAFTASSFNVLVAPIIASFNPTSGPVGTTLTIQGNNFVNTPADNIVLFGTIPATVTVATATQLTVNVPVGAISNPIAVTVNGLTAISNASFTVTLPPTIMSFSPASGQIGTAVTIRGSNFSTNISENIVKFGPVQSAVISATPTQLTVIVPAGSTTQSIYVTVNGLTTSTSASFIIIFPPVIISFNPGSGPIGTNVTITGSNFSNSTANNIVWFGVVQATVISATTSQLTVSVPIGATSSFISLTVNGLAVISNNPFNVTSTPPPVINSFSPTSGPVGTTLTINGNNFSTTAADNIVIFGNIQATVTASTPTQLTITIPAGVTSQPFMVTVNGLTVYSNNPFNVTTSGTGPNNNSFEFESPVLTLNGDGINDRLIIKNFEGYGKCSISVYNSRGVLIYSNKDYKNDWDLTINGRLLETGGYFYIAETDSGIYRGSFSILRPF